MNILDNLTGGQIQEILDHLLIETIRPIIENTDIFDSQIVYILAAVTKNKKRKLSSVPREELISLLATYLSTKNRTKKVELLKEVKIEREMLYKFVKNVLEHLKYFDELYLKYINAEGEDRVMLYKRLEVLIRPFNSDIESMWRVVNICPSYLKVFFEFRNMIVNNYYKLTLKQANIFCSAKTGNFDHQDVWNNFLSAVIKALDKYDCSKGALTSYIKWWLLNVQNSNHDTGEYSVAYTVPHAHRKTLATGKSNSSNFSLSLSYGDDTDVLEYHDGNSVSEETLYEKSQEVNIVLALIKKSDYRGIYRLYNSVEETYFKEEYDKMVKTMKKQGTL